MAENYEITRETVHKLLPRRSPYIHKGDCGRVLILAGASGMAGAAVLSVRGSMRSGAGLTYICTPKANYPVLQTAVPEAICVDWDRVADKLAGRGNEPWNYDVIAFGPGMGVSASSRRMLKAILLSYDGPLVIDADGLNLLAREHELTGFAQNYSGELILTPHVGEAKRLLEDVNLDQTTSREEMAEALVRKYRGIAILKGAGTLVARYSSALKTGAVTVWRNTSGNPGMATGGAGDVLTGVIAALTAQGLSPWDAARAGVLIHGAAGDLAADDKGEYGMIASDIVEKLPYAIDEIINMDVTGDEDEERKS